MTACGTSTGGDRPDVDAAIARWAAAAGVPESVAREQEPALPAGRRLLRGVLAGCAVGMPLLVLGSVDGPSGGLRLALVLVLLLLTVRILQRRRA